MAPLLLFLLSLYHLHMATYSELVTSSDFNLNALSEKNDDLSVLLPPEVDTENTLNTNAAKNSKKENELDVDSIPFIRTSNDQTEVEFRHPVASVNIDYARNIIILKFRRERPKQRVRPISEEDEKLRLLKDDFMRFGKRSPETIPAVNSLDQDFEEDSVNRNTRSGGVLRDSRGDNFMRFGRTPNDFMRFGRAASDFMRFGRNPGDFMRFGRAPATDFMRLGRSGPNDFMRFGRAASDFMRFGRNPSDFMRLGKSAKEDFMRFGRDPKDDFMRFGRNPKEDFMRFGRNPQEDFIRFGRNQKLRRQSDKNFMRFGRPDNFMRFGRTVVDTKAKEAANFMRFGKSIKDYEKENNTKPLFQKGDVKAVAKFLHDTAKESEESNPVDKAIEVLFNSQAEQQEQERHKQQLLEQKDKNIDGDEIDLESEYESNTRK